ncbi:TonB-dependent receptor [Thalassomonas viridans]|uniref:TonB-dependent receptor n=1 Tax=Thalassomonas viridans TaxID=137584 RepID=A0AAE9YZ95_9GAMM|nr:TonB-dependent receptor [Thalassomonas viridans]WDE03144.1 TonB-dependent receptor [Thalassomonas viridans]
MKPYRLSRITGALVIALGLSTSAMAAETSSSMRGKIVGPQGNDAANVKITVLHQPSGTVSEFVTNDSGVFIAKGLRVGGPYTIYIDSDQHQDTALENIFLSLGDTYRLNTQLEPQVEVERIAVTGHRFTQDVGGSNSVFGADAIENTPSFDKDIKDIARMNPLATINGSGEMSIAGGNPRTNSLTVDGIGQNDDFGLQFGGYPTAQPPVSLDAIEQISVDASPFTAKKGKFGGGTINAVTKSGTNEFKFSSFYETSTPSMAGDVESISQVFDEDGRAVLDENGHRTYEVSKVEPIQTEKRFGFNVGGPIIEDKLFFFVNYSDFTSELDMDYGFEGSGATHEYDVSEENFNEFLRILDSTYGLQDSLGGDPKDTNENVLAKLSWNINDAHRLDFTYQWQDDQVESNFGTGGSTVKFASSRYNYVTKFNNFATKIYSDWSDDFTTEIGISYKDVTSDSKTNSDVGSVKVEEFFRGPAYEFGRDETRHANASETSTFVLSLDATYLLGDHEIEFGAQYERLRLYNLFARNSLGSWEFDNFEDFENRVVGNFRGEYDFSYDNAYTNDPNDTAYEAVRKQYSLYVEDTFYLTDDIEVSAGVRYERLASSDKPTVNENFVNTYGYDNTENLDGLDIILPRFNLTWYASDDLTVRAGVGRFQGGVPNVWYNNPFQMDGITLVSAPDSVIDAYYAENLADITKVPDEIKNSLVQGAGSTTYTDPNFKLPSSWRAQVGFDYTFDLPYLGEGFKWTNELMYHKLENEAIWVNKSITPVGVAADGERVITESIYEGDLAENYDIEMTNADDDGRSVIFTTSLAKAWDNGVSMTMSYAHQDITNNHVGSASAAAGNYKHNIIKNRNENSAERSSYEIEHSFKLTLGYTTEFFEGYATRFNMYLERRSGRPYSHTMGMYRDRDLGDNEAFYSQSAYLPYIPTGADDPFVNWEESGISWNELEVLLDKAGISERGEILDRNTGTQPWVTSLDISIKQEIPGFAEGHSGQIYLMIDNFANLLNDDWGVEKKLRYPNQSIYDFGGLDDQGRYIIDARFNGADTRNYDTIDTGASAWQAKIGISYKF